MVTRGVASVRSPVKNLQEFNPTVTHGTYVDAMVQAFREEYHVEEPVCPVTRIFPLLTSCFFVAGLGTIYSGERRHRLTVHPIWHRRAPCKDS